MSRNLPGSLSYLVCCLDLQIPRKRPNETFIDAIGYNGCFGTRNNSNAIKHVLLQMDSTGEDLDEIRMEMLQTILRLDGLCTLEIRICEDFGSERWEAFKFSLLFLCEHSKSLESAMLLGQYLFHIFDDYEVDGTLYSSTDASWRDMSQMTRMTNEKGTITWRMRDGFYDAVHATVITESEKNKYLKLMLAAPNRWCS